MIPESYVEAWRTTVNWPTLNMVEQDLIISRALASLYSNQHIKDHLVFRGGTALNKLYINPPARYSEDIDLVQRNSEPIGQTIDIIRKILGPWLGEPVRKFSTRCTKLVYHYQTIDGLFAKLKLEINTTEHFQILPLKAMPFSIDSEWHKDDCQIITYQLEELIATKLRALYQRRKGRDLFDLWLVFKSALVDIDLVLETYKKYCEKEGFVVTRELFLKNLEAKRLNRDFRVDMNILLPHQTNWDFEEAFDFVKESIIGKII